jgi:hypothetical protein
MGDYEDENGVITIAMNGWGAPEPAWWRNLHAQPETTLAQAGGTTISVFGRSTVGEERDRCANAGHNSTNGSTASMLARPTDHSSHGPRAQKPSPRRRAPINRSGRWPSPLLIGTYALAQVRESVSAGAAG